MDERQREELAEELKARGLRDEFVGNLLDGIYGDELQFARRAAFLRQERRDRKRRYRDS